MKVTVTATPVACDHCGGSTLRRQAQGLRPEAVASEGFLAAAHGACRVPVAYRVEGASTTPDGVYCARCCAFGVVDIGQHVFPIDRLPVEAFQKSGDL